MDEWHSKRAEAAYDALLGYRDDVYPCREDIPAELWGRKIHRRDKRKVAEEILRRKKEA